MSKNMEQDMVALMDELKISKANYNISINKMNSARRKKILIKEQLKSLRKELKEARKNYRQEKRVINKYHNYLKDTKNEMTNIVDDYWNETEEQNQKTLKK